MNLFYPVDMKWQITQKFMEHPSRYISRSGHPGIDFGCPVNSALYACIDGDVTAAGYRAAGGYGREIFIKSGNWLFIYGHALDLTVKVGDHVRRGQIIGSSGGEITDPLRGNSTGAHLHFEMRDLSKPQVLPLIGAVDPTPYLEGSASIQPPAVNRTLVTVVTDKVNIRRAPNTDLPEIGSITRGQILQTAGPVLAGPGTVISWQPVIVYIATGINGEQYLK